MVRVAVDAMGGDFAPGEIVKGAVEAARDGVEVLLVGEEAPVSEYLSQYLPPGLNMSLVPAQGTVKEGKSPVQSLKQLSQASVAVATSLIKEGRADAMVTMGSTGAALVCAHQILGTLEGIERPCLAGPFLGLAPKTVIVDLGANVDCRPGQLLDFAVLGSVFARQFLGISQPRVALLSVGSEEGKGNRQVKEAYGLFKSSGLNFVGNVEGFDPFTNKADVLVCDGYVGNVLMKFSEGLGLSLAFALRKRLGGKLAPEALEEVCYSVLKSVSISEEMGAPILGVQGVVIVGHGRAKASGVKGAIGVAKLAVEMGLVEALQSNLAEIRRKMQV
ncbi:MAG: phosphate acyltransferase PlsX [Chloroflexi bacterium]|nr:phosphate acyltransferase PlsX [Chloroflexota bacterium]